MLPRTTFSVVFFCKKTKVTKKDKLVPILYTASQAVCKKMPIFFVRFDFLRTFVLTILLNKFVNTGRLMNGAKKSNTEQLILEAAEEEFLIKGYEGARTTAIAEKAGVTHAMLHYYFRTKEQLFERIIVKISAILVQTMIVAMGDPQKPILERIKSGIDSHFDLIAAHPLLPRFFLNEIVLRPERYSLLPADLKDRMAALYMQLQADLDLAAARGEVEAIDVRMLLVSIVSLNAFPFIALPFAELLLGNLAVDHEKFFADRKAENMETILRRIKKQ